MKDIKPNFVMEVNFFCRAMSTAHTFPVMRPLYAESFEERVASRPSVRIRARFVEHRIIINARDGRRIHLSNIERRAEEQVT